jgi:transcriptional regulator with XRE-family HTH domain
MVRVMTLHEWRKAKRWTQLRLAMEIGGGCAQSLAAKYERGEVLPSVERRQRIEAFTDGAVTSRGMLLRYRHVRREGHARGAAFRVERGIE